jgi:hypothetical protein
VNRVEESEMSVHLKSFRKWIRQIYATRGEELDCREFFEMLPQYVDMEISDEDAALHFPQVKHHLGQCAECHDVYLTLREVARLESREAVSELVRVRRSR